MATADSRIKRMAFGGGDYTLDLNYEWNADESVLAYARAKLSHAARLGNLEPPIDTVVLQIKDDERFLQSARHGKQFGFGGKLCIHPAQIPLIQRYWPPSDGQLALPGSSLRRSEAPRQKDRASISLTVALIVTPLFNKISAIRGLPNKFLTNGLIVGCFSRLLKWVVY